MIEPKFKSKELVSKQKLRGGYYTPLELANFISDWILESDVNSILEPSFGDGNFLESLLIRNSEKFRNKIEITAVELNTEEFIKGVNRTSELTGSEDIHFINEDFFNSYSKYGEESFDAVIGNPPYIRFQYFDNQSRQIAFSHLERNGYKPSKLANVWSAFTQLSIASLKVGGKIGFVIPAELLQVKYADQLRNRILKNFKKSTIIAFKEIVFPGILQEVVILMCEGKTKKLVDDSVIRLIELQNGSCLNGLRLDQYPFHPITKSIREGHKWTSLFIDDSRLKILSSSVTTGGVELLGDFARVNVGIVTGRNKFFVLSKKQVDELDLYEFVTPIVGKTSAFKKSDFTRDDFTEYSDLHPCYLLDLNNIDESDFSDNLHYYIKAGENENVDKGYKCRIRKKWYAVPSAHKSDGFLFRQVYKYPLLVDNSANATCTDTIHRVILNDDSLLSISALSIGFINSLTFAYSELIGRSYGGGVLELEPREALLLPIVTKNLSSINKKKINSLLQNGEIETALDYSDQILLIDGLGFDKKRVQQIRSVWHTLRDRRLKRG